MELKLMMEKLGAPQTHLGLKNMIKEVDEDFDSKLSFREVGPAAALSPRLQPEGLVAWETPAPFVPERWDCLQYWVLTLRQDEDPVLIQHPG